MVHFYAIINWVELSRGSSFLWVELSQGSNGLNPEYRYMYIYKF